MRFANLDTTAWTGSGIPVPPQPDRNRRQRILDALGMTRGEGLAVSEDTLARYFDFLAENLKLPFAACYPAASAPASVARDRCTVIELLDPRTMLGDEIDGLFCRTRKQRFIVNLPLIELGILEPDSNRQLVEDFAYWFWHWRN